MSRLRKSFAAPDGASRQVVDVDVFALEERAQVALRGESGSGKTTFLHLIAGILEPDAGRIARRTGNVRLTESARDRLRATTLGYIFQTFNLLQGYTCLENVLLGMSFGPGAGPAFARRHCWIASDWGSACIIIPASFPPASNSAWPSRGRWPTGRSSSWRTNRPAISTNATRANRWRLIREACRENGAALLLVSHDREVLAQFETDARISPAINRSVAGGVAMTLWQIVSQEPAAARAVHHRDRARPSRWPAGC